VDGIFNRCAVPSRWPQLHDATPSHCQTHFQTHCRQTTPNPLTLSPPQVKELEAAVDRAAEQPQRFNLSTEEVASRRKWVTGTRRAIDGMLETLKTATAAAPVNALEVKVGVVGGVERCGFVVACARFAAD